jgi:hypothetical protein
MFFVPNNPCFEMRIVPTVKAVDLSTDVRLNFFVFTFLCCDVHRTATTTGCFSPCAGKMVFCFGFLDRQDDESDDKGQEVCSNRSTAFTRNSSATTCLSKDIRLL